MRPLTLLIFLLVLLQQAARGQDISYIDLYPDTAITVLGQDFFLSRVDAITYAPKYGYFFGDRRWSQIAQTDRQFQLIRTLGRPGEGPEELGSVRYLHVWGDTLFVATRGVIKKFLLPDFRYLDRYLIRTRCFHCIHITPYGIAQTVVNSETPLRLYDLKGHVLHQFGRVLEPNHPSSVFLNLRAGVFITEAKEILAVPQLQNQVERYAFDGKLREVFRLDQPPALIQVFRKAQRRTQELQRTRPYALAPLWGDVTYAKGLLYLATAQRWPEASHIQHVLVVRVTQERMQLSHILRLHRDQTPLQMGLLEKANSPQDVYLSARLIEVIPETNTLLAWMLPENLLYVYTLPEQP